MAPARIIEEVFFSAYVWCGDVAPNLHAVMRDYISDNEVVSDFVTLKLLTCDLKWR